MARLEDVLSEFPTSTREMVRQAWTSMPGEQRVQLELLLSGLPSGLKPLKTILSYVVEQYAPVLEEKRAIAILGPANAGKSTLYNQLVTRREDRAVVSPIPGTTRENQQADTGLFTVIDTPGADAVGEVGQRERDIALEAARQADFLVILFEATRGIKRSELDLFDALLALDKPYIVVLNKMDLIPKKDRGRVCEAAAKNLRLEVSQVIPTVATEGSQVGSVILAIAKAEPRLLAAIAEAMPEYRAKLAWQRIVPAAASAAAVGLIPLPFADLIPLAGIQAGLVLTIARIYQEKITLGRAKELIATFGVGLIARTVFQEVSKLGGVPGWILSAGIAAATTVAIGYGAMAWFAHGEKPTRESLQRVVSEVTGYLRDQLKDMGQQKPERGALRHRISEALKGLPGRLRPGAEADENRPDADASEP